MIQPTNEDLAYIAGYFDGEGSVTVTHVARRYPSLRISVATGDTSVIKRFCFLFGGEPHVEKPRAYTKRQMLRWYLDGKRAQEVLTQLLPYLRAKYEVAKLALTMPIGRLGERVTPEKGLKRLEVSTAIKAFNQRVTIGQLN